MIQPSGGLFIEDNQDLYIEYYIFDNDLPVEILKDLADIYVFEPKFAVGIDIETTGLYYQNDKITLVQIFDPVYARVFLVRVRDTVFPHSLVSLLQHKSVTKIFHHSEFDLSFLSYHYQVLVKNVIDTKLLARIVNPLANRSETSLVSLLYHYFNVYLEKSTATSNWCADDLTETQIRYAVRDVVYLPMLRSQLASQLKPDVLQAAESVCNHSAAHIWLKVTQGINLYEKRVL